MYSLTFCVRVMLPERHQWKPAVQAVVVMLRTPPSTASHRPAARADPTQTAVRSMSSYRGIDASFLLGFALCCHSNATHAPIANSPKSAQLGGSLYHASKLHPGPCSSVGVRPRTDTQTDRQTHRRAWPQYILRRLRLTHNVMIFLRISFLTKFRAI